MDETGSIGNLGPHARPNVFEIDLDAVAHYTLAIRRHIGADVRLFAALKANAYGFGLLAIARTVQREGADGLAVVGIGDAVALRRHGITGPLLVYPGDVIDADAARAVVRYQLILTLTDLPSAHTLASHASHALLPIEVAVKVDLGQERFGFGMETAAEAVLEIARLPNLKVAILNSHPNVPLVPNPAYHAWQLEKFDAICECIARAGLKVPMRMLASSRLLSVSGKFNCDAVDPGQMLFGPLRTSGDVPWPTPRSALHALKSRLVHVKSVQRTEFLEAAPFPVHPGMRIGVIPIGASDGVSACHCGAVLVRGHRVPLLGAPSLEHLRLDLTRLPEAVVGDEVVLIGAQGAERITPEEVAAARGHPRLTDIAMAIRSSIPRRYLPVRTA